MSRKNDYIPAFGVDWLTPLYDPMQRWIMQEDHFKRDLVQRNALEPGQRILDLGCGTGTLTLMLKQAQPDAEIVGLDGDGHVLARAKTKSTLANEQVLWAQGLAFELPSPDQTFDRVVSSLVFHHLTHENKQRAFTETFRVLRPSGELYVLDFGQPRTSFAKAMALFLSHFEEVADNLNGLLPGMMSAAGFDQVEEKTYYTTLFGTLTLFHACKFGSPE